VVMTVGVGRGTGNVVAMTTATKRRVREVCTECDEEFERKSGRRMHRCPKCRQRRNVEVMDANHAKSGPIWETTVRTSLTYWKSEARRLGLK
jgi:hypothetical protein